MEADSRAKSLIENGDRLFSKRSSLLSLWQEIADNFYPEREGFTLVRPMGEDFAAHLMTSYPVLIRRDLGDSLSAMLRPAGEEWFHMRTERNIDDNSAKRWLEYATGVQRRAMYDPDAQFIRATKEGDHDFASFGQCVLTVEQNREDSRLLYRCWHLKDVAWCEGLNGKPEIVYRKWDVEIRLLAKYFPGKLSKKLTDKHEKDPYCKTEVCHVVLPSKEYDAPVGKKWRTPYVSIYIDKENHSILEEAGVWVHPYIIPRWKTISGSQYAVSPATIAALPDSRTLQAMTLTLLDAGEKAANPPLVAKRNLFREDLQFFAGGLTWADYEGDRGIREHLEVLTNDKSGIPFGLDMREDLKNELMSAFYLNRINLPPPDGKMTAYEASLRNQEFIRNTLPLFEPMEHDYNGAICEKTFEILFRANAFGPMELIPKSLLGENVQFVFESPLHEAIERKKVDQFGIATELLRTAMEFDTSAAASFDAVTAYRDSASGAGIPSKWLRPEEEAMQIVEQHRVESETQKFLELQDQSATVDQRRAQADQAMKEAASARAA